MSRPIKSIETSYAGCKFRSRVEARWAVFFDHLGIKWQYEPEGFELPDGSRYLPDFFLPLAPGKWSSFDKYPGAGYWVEVKGKRPTAGELNKLQQLCSGTSHHGYLVYGTPGDNSPVFVSMTPSPESQKASLKKFFGLLGWSGMSKEQALYHSGFIDGCAAGEGTYDVDGAISAAKSARFEFGESGSSRKARGTC